MAIFSIFSTFLLCAIFVSIFQYANNLQSSWPPQPTPTWAGAKIHELFDIQQALSKLDKIFRKPPDFSKSKTPGLVKANKKFKSHQEHQQEPEQSENVEANEYCRKLGLPASGQNNKVAKDLAKFVRQQLSLELVEVSKSNPFIAIDLLSFSLMKIKVNQFT